MTAEVATANPASDGGQSTRRTALRGNVDLHTVNQELNKQGLQSSCLCNRCIHISDRLLLRPRPTRQPRSGTPSPDCDQPHRLLLHRPTLESISSTDSCYTYDLQIRLPTPLRCSISDPTPYEHFVYDLPNKSLIFKFYPPVRIIFSFRCQSLLINKCWRDRRPLISLGPATTALVYPFLRQFSKDVWVTLDSFSWHPVRYGMIGLFYKLC